MLEIILGFGIFMLGCGIGFLLGLKAKNKKGLIDIPSKEEAKK